MADEITLADSNTGAVEAPVTDAAADAAADAAGGFDTAQMATDFYAGEPPDRDADGNEIPKPAEKPEDKPEDKKLDEPGDKPPVEEPESKPEPKAGLFDRDRQQSDQHAANARRRDEANQKTIDELTGIVKAQQAAALQTPPDTAQADADKEITALLATLKAVDSDGDRTATAADAAQVAMEIQAIKAKLLVSDPSQSSTANEEILKALKTLSDRMDAADEAADRAQSSTDLNVMLDGFDNQYSVTDKEGKVTSGMYRNDVIGVVRKQLADDGLDEENLPHASHVRLLLDAAYKGAFAADPLNKGKAPKAKIEVPVDPGKGGATIPTAPSHGDNDQVFADMEASGEFG